MRFHSCAEDAVFSAAEHLDYPQIGGRRGHPGSGHHQSARGTGLKAGEVVSTGTCNGLDAVHPGDVAWADFGALGAVEIEFELQERLDDGR